MLISCHYNNIITFGSLVGISNILELPRRSIGRAKTQVLKRKRGKKSKSRSWLFCLCSNSNSGSNPDAENNPPSLGQFLALERRASNENRKNQIISLLIMCPDNELALTQTIEEARSYILFVNGTIDPSQSISVQGRVLHRENACRASGYDNTHGLTHLQKYVCNCIIIFMHKILVVN